MPNNFKQKSSFVANLAFGKGPWIVVGILFGIATGIASYKLLNNNQIINNTPLPDIVISAKNTQENGQKKFEFYDVLAKSSTQNKLLPKDKEPPNTLELTTSKATKYLLQVGAFKNLAAADAKKAELSLLGFKPHLQKLKVDNQILYRLTLGPYNSEQETLELKNKLEQQNIHGTTILKRQA